jgi:hypothetical protein
MREPACEERFGARSGNNQHKNRESEEDSETEEDDQIIMPDVASLSLFSRRSSGRLAG